MEAALFFWLLAVGGMWLLCDGWFSISYYKRTTETFWGNHIIRILRIAIGLELMFMSWWFIYRIAL